MHFWTVISPQKCEHDVAYQIFTQPMQLIYTFKRNHMATLLPCQYAASITQGFTSFKVGLWCINTSLLGQNLFRHNGNFINIPLKIHIKPQYDLTLINPLQQELYISTPTASHSLAVPPQIHQVSPSTCSSVSRRRQWLKRSSPARCSLGGRSGREGGRSEGSSGDPPRRSAPSYTPGREKGGTRMRHLLWKITWAWRER